MALVTVDLKRIRENAGYSRSELARLARMQASTITNIESGRFIPYDSQLKKIADVLGVDNPESLLQPLRVVGDK